MSQRLKILLLDNGSVRPQAVFQLRQLAEKLSEVSGYSVAPVSLRHSNRISADDLQGVPAETFTSYLRGELRVESTRFIVLPLFFAMNSALSEYVPEQLKLLKSEFGEVNIQLAEVVYPLPDGEPSLVAMLHDHVQSNIDSLSTPDYSVVLVDHGSPSPQVTAVRQHAAQALSKSLDGMAIDQAVMERRDGKEYDFNGPLLEQYLSEQAASGVKSVIVVLMFFLPGRHAGAEGDIDEICSRAMGESPGFSVRVSPLVGEHEALIELLHSRLLSVIPGVV